MDSYGQMQCDAMCWHTAALDDKEKEGCPCKEARRNGEAECGNDGNAHGGRDMKQRCEVPRQTLSLSRQHGTGTVTHISYPSSQETEVVEYSFQRFVNAVHITLIQNSYYDKVQEFYSSLNKSSRLDKEQFYCCFGFVLGDFACFSLLIHERDY